jgi:hypothetical protein
MTGMLLRILNVADMNPSMQLFKCDGLSAAIRSRPCLVSAIFCLIIRN